MDVKHVLEQIRRSAREGKIQYSNHAVDRMLERKIRSESIDEVLQSTDNQVIEEQPPSTEKDRSHKNSRYLIYSPQCAIYRDIIIILALTSKEEISIITVEETDPTKWKRSGKENPYLIRIG